MNVEQGIFQMDYWMNFTQCYPNGQIKFSELNNLLQLTASEHAENIGFGYRTMLKAKQSWVLSRMLIEVDSLPRYMEKITIRTWIQEFTGSRTLRNFEVLQHDQILVRASSLWVVFNMATRRADKIAIDSQYHDILSDRSSTHANVAKVDGSIPFHTIAEYRIKLSDLDIVNHANNVKYMEWCFDAIDPKIILNGSIKSLEMNFLKELKYNDVVLINESDKAEDTVTYNIQKEDKIHFLMKLGLR